MIEPNNFLFVVGVGFSRQSLKSQRTIARRVPSSLLRRVFVVNTHIFWFCLSVYSYAVLAISRLRVISGYITTSTWRLNAERHRERKWHFVFCPNSNLDGFLLKQHTTASSPPYVRRDSKKISYSYRNTQYIPNTNKSKIL